MPAVQARKSYTCPQCGNEVPERRRHVVAWPIGDVEYRRHWHEHCWRLVAGRGKID